MILFHGTDSKSAKSIYDEQTVDVTVGSSKVDFGQGFYMTDDKTRALNWAYRKAVARKGKPALVTIYFDIDAAKPFITSFEDDLRWGQFIINNRNGLRYISHMVNKEHNLDAKYHITYGRVADIDVLRVADRLLKTNKELGSLDDILNKSYPFQYVLHTDFSTQFIQKITYENL